MAEDTSNKHLHPRSASEHESANTIAPDHGISINLPPGSSDGRPSPVKHMSAPAYQSPIRHHRRAPSKTRGVKETLNARSQYGSSDDDGSSVHRINQYIIKQEIGRGSFGAVHLAVDQLSRSFPRPDCVSVRSPIYSGNPTKCGDRAHWQLGLVVSILHCIESPPTRCPKMKLTTH